MNWREIECGWPFRQWIVEGVSSAPHIGGRVGIAEDLPQGRAKCVERAPFETEEGLLITCRYELVTEYKHGDQGSQSMPPYKGPSTPKQTVTHRSGDVGFYAILDELGDLHEKKNADYGLPTDHYANVCAAEELGIEPWRAAMMRANEKITRIKAFCRNGRLENEPLEDSLLDLASYAVIALRLYRKRYLKTIKTEA